MRFADEPEEPEVDTITDEQFFGGIAAELERRRLLSEKPAYRPTTTGQLVFAYAVTWLLGAAVLLALAAGVIALAKLVASLF